MFRRIARMLLEPVARVLRRFFDPRIAQLDRGLREEIERVGARIERVSDTAAARDRALRDGITFTNTRLGRIESELEEIRRRLDVIAAALPDEDGPGVTGDRP